MTTQRQQQQQQFRATLAAQQQASSRNRRLTLQMANRPAVQAALKLKAVSDASRFHSVLYAGFMAYLCDSHLWIPFFLIALETFNHHFQHQIEHRACVLAYYVPKCVMV